MDPPSANQPPGRHRATRAADSDPLGLRRRRLLTSRPLRLGVATAFVGALGFVAYTEAQRPTDTAPVSPAAIAERDAAADQAASRSFDRAAATPSPTASPTPAATPTPKKPPAPARVAPVAGLTQAQMDNARAIVQAGAKEKVPRFGLIVAVATAMQESNLYNLASGVVPESQNYPNQGMGYDHDSVGLFQQRSSTGWGAVRDLMRPAFAAQQFYRELLKVPGWEQLSLTVAAQRVQKSAFPDAYAKHEPRATAVVDALLT
ncbi:hypothetical protein SAMN05444365_10924 [Micromonospora pattaloongensis]|uniref:Peptidase M23 n=1 Tax=Micromonospora pattaloongensis TaxID=405436 RepID=A0A1H3RSQ9_9ACTN|nr:hypothetical protein [Micromonospora pattaloongensis]SDZ28241.1 hypothetical protein SAMN05444365_10924 [Micromonospora pattaloongensis]